MIVAELNITSGRSVFGQGMIHRVSFEDVVIARAEFERVADLIQRRSDRANDLPKTVRVEGVGAIDMPLEDIGSVAFMDFAKANAAEIGVKDAFPNLFKK